MVCVACGILQTLSSNNIHCSENKHIHSTRAIAHKNHIDQTTISLILNLSMMRWSSSKVKPFQDFEFFYSNTHTRGPQIHTEFSMIANYLIIKDYQWIHCPTTWLIFAVTVQLRQRSTCSSNALHWNRPMCRILERRVGLTKVGGIGHKTGYLHAKCGEALSIVPYIIAIF